jgi:hypothetical protein
MFGRKNLVHIRGKKNGVVGVLWKALKRKEREGKLVAIPIDEYYTSQVNIDDCQRKIIDFSLTLLCKVCNGCGRRDLKNVNHRIVVCKNCQILWQRDINAGKNMYNIAEAIWNGGQRPSQFDRPERQPLQQPHHIAAANAVSSAS